MDGAICQQCGGQRYYCGCGHYDPRRELHDKQEPDEEPQFRQEFFCSWPWPLPDHTAVHGPGAGRGTRRAG